VLASHTHNYVVELVVQITGYFVVLSYQQHDSSVSKVPSPLVETTESGLQFTAE